MPATPRVPTDHPVGRPAGRSPDRAGDGPDDRLNALLGDRDVLRTLASEPLVGLAAGRALLMQLAHPAVARGVAEHSDFADRPLARLFGTLDFLLIATYGTPEQVGRIAAKVRGIHTTVRGEGYSGNDPDLQLWVNATLIDSALHVHERLMRGDDPGFAEAYYRQARIVADVLGCPLESQPADLAAFRAYMAGTLAELRVTATAREVADAVLWPRRLRALVPAHAVFRLVTAALLPEELRDQFGLPWTPARRRAASALLRTAALTHRLTPAPLRRPPEPLLVRLATYRVDRTLSARRARRRAD